MFRKKTLLGLAGGIVLIALPTFSQETIYCSC
jgi:hypothetical protein